MVASFLCAVPSRTIVFASLGAQIPQHYQGTTVKHELKPPASLGVCFRINLFFGRKIARKTGR
jgi:hypothetical protein